MSCKASQSADNSHILGNGIVAFHEKAQGILYPSKGTDGLHKASQLHLPCKILWGTHEDRHDNGNLGIAVDIKIQQLGTLHQCPEIADNHGKTLMEILQLRLFATVKGNAFAVFPHPYHAETEIRLVPLLVIVQSNELPAYLVGQPGAQDRVQQGDKYHVPRHRQHRFPQGNIQCAGKLPQDKDKGNQRCSLLQHSYKKAQGQAYKGADIIGNTLIRVIHVLIAPQLEPIVNLPIHPSFQIVVRHPGTPFYLQDLIYIDGIYRHDDVQKGNARKLANKWPKGIKGPFLQGIVKIIVPLVQQHQHIYLGKAQGNYPGQQSPGLPLLLGFPVGLHKPPGHGVNLLIGHSITP